MDRAFEQSKALYSAMLDFVPAVPLSMPELKKRVEEIYELIRPVDLKVEISTVFPNSVYVNGRIQAPDGNSYDLPPRFIMGGTVSQIKSLMCAVEDLTFMCYKLNGGDKFNYSPDLIDSIKGSVSNERTL